MCVSHERQQMQLVGELENSAPPALGEGLTRPWRVSPCQPGECRASRDILHLCGTSTINTPEPGEKSLEGQHISPNPHLRGNWGWDWAEKSLLPPLPRSRCSQQSSMWSWTGLAGAAAGLPQTPVGLMLTAPSFSCLYFPLLLGDFCHGGARHGQEGQTRDRDQAGPALQPCSHS